MGYTDNRTSPQKSHTMARSNSKRPRREVLLRPIDPDDSELIADLRAAAHLQRTTPREIIVDVVKRKLGPRFAKHLSAA